ncbi:MAG TPA: aldo/keto reductase [Candidatus Dormibacteraeota bacterium]|nr:aldo/keto reductase [Candidatus Dormibacteraeota bacterium]
MKLGDVDVARIGLGTNRLTHTVQNVDLIRAAVEADVQMVDTAHLYTNGQSEQAIGEALSPFPPNVVVATKGGFGGAGRGRAEVLRAEIEESFRRLKTETITLYYLHRVDPETPIEESLGAIKDYRDRGRIRHVGISEVTVEQIERARKVVPIAAVQNHYNLAERGYDAEVDYCAREGIVFVPFYPLRGGGGWSQLAAITRRHRATPQQVMLAWLLRRSPVMLPIPGTLSLAHLRENVGALKIQLTDEEFEALA